MSKYLLTGVLMSLMAGCHGGGGEVANVVEAGKPGSLSREVTFKGYKGLELQGTLLVPQGGSKAPAVLLLPGSGPTDRDGNQPGLQIDILKSIAEKLAASGVVSLRFDKRAVAAKYAKDFPKDLAALDDFFSWEAFVEDAEAAFAFMKSQPEVDGARAAVLGHSEGGIIAVAMAKTSTPKALILVSTPARNLGDVIIEQISQGYSSKTTPPDMLRKLVAEAKRVVGVIRTTGKVPSGIMPELVPIFPAYAARYLHSVMVFEPASEAASYNGPVLIVQGAKDIQVSAERDAPKLKAAIKGSELYMVPDASHCLKHVSGNMDPGFTGPVIPAALDKIAGWSKDKL